MCIKSLITLAPGEFKDIYGFSPTEKWFEIRQANVWNQFDKMEQHALKNVNNCLYTNVYSYLETSGDISYNLYLNVVHFFNTRVN